MKLASLVVVMMLGAIAHADDREPVDPYARDRAPVDPFAQPARAPVDPFVQAAYGMQRGQLRQLLMERFDRNRDGRLEPNERRHAARALRRLARKLMRHDMQQGMMRQGMQQGPMRQGMQQGPMPPAMQPGMQPNRRARFIRRYDLDGDGNVGPGELPPSVADQLRPLDRDGDGWLRDDELP